MLRIGLDADERAAVLADRLAQTGASKVFVIGPARFPIPGWDRPMSTPETECDGRRGCFLDWPGVIQYRWYYRLLQQVDRDTLLVLNEPLRTQDRHDLSYNCIRQYLQQAGHALVFSTFPIIESTADVMILIDFVTRSRWRRDPFRPEMLSELDVRVRPRGPRFEEVPVAVDARTHAAYDRTRARLFEEARANGDSDPHVIPRALHLESGRCKAAVMGDGPALVRNQRLRLADAATYRTVDRPGPRAIIDWPHRTLDLCDALTVIGERHVPVLVADTKADRWYTDRYLRWAQEVRDVEAALHG